MYEFLSKYAVSARILHVYISFWHIFLFSNKDLSFFLGGGGVHRLFIFTIHSTSDTRVVSINFQLYLGAKGQ